MPKRHTEDEPREMVMDARERVPVWERDAIEAIRPALNREARRKGDKTRWTLQRVRRLAVKKFVEDYAKSHNIPLPDRGDYYT